MDRELRRMDFPDGEFNPGWDCLRLAPQPLSCRENRRHLSAQRPPSGGRYCVLRWREIMQGVDAASACPLSSRQVERLRWARAGKSDAAIGTLLGIFARTVHNHWKGPRRSSTPRSGSSRRARRGDAAGQSERQAPAHHDERRR